MWSFLMLSRIIWQKTHPNQRFLIKIQSEKNRITIFFVRVYCFFLIPIFSYAFRCCCCCCFSIITIVFVVELFKKSNIYCDCSSIYPATKLQIRFDKQFILKQKRIKQVSFVVFSLLFFVTFVNYYQIWRLRVTN